MHVFLLLQPPQANVRCIFWAELFCFQTLWLCVSLRESHTAIRLTEWAAVYLVFTAVDHVDYTLSRSIWRSRRHTLCRRQQTCCLGLPAQVHSHLQMSLTALARAHLYSATILLCKVKRQYLLTFQVSRYCLLALRATTGVRLRPRPIHWIILTGVSVVIMCRKAWPGGTITPRPARPGHISGLEVPTPCIQDSNWPKAAYWLDAVIYVSSRT